MKIQYFSKYSDNGPSSRYRIFQFVEYFRQAGVEVQIQELFDNRYLEILRMPSPFLGNIRKSWYVLSRFKKRKQALRTAGFQPADLVIIEHQLFPYLPFALEKRYLPGRYLLEFDDAIYLTHPKKFPEMIRRAVAVISGNNTLADYASRLNRNVHVIPTVIDTDRFQPAHKTRHEKIRIGWSGLEYNFKYLRLLEPVFLKLIRYDLLEIVVLSGTPPRGLSFPFRFEKWDAGKEAEQIGQFDIGVMPLEIDEWSKGKCGMKLLQCMSLGIPSVATPVGVNTKIIREGENGFTAITPEDWEARLSLLIENASLREEVGKAARRTVEERYSVRVWFPKILDLYKSYCL